MYECKITTVSLKSFGFSYNSAESRLPAKLLNFNYSAHDSTRKKEVNTFFLLKQLIDKNEHSIVPWLACFSFFSYASMLN